MNITDIDDKTIGRSQVEYPGEDPTVALRMLTEKYEQLFFEDAKLLGIDFRDSQFVRATDEIKSMQSLIHKIKHKYVSDDGIYFSIGDYPDYGRFVKLDRTHAHHRISNDEYDKDDVADFALWKRQKEGEPSWDFKVDSYSMRGRPGWHLECSAISTKYLGHPFDIHTGGVDLIFPHHENEIAQSKSATNQELAKVFLHGQHLLVESRKMSKSLNNFITIEDIVKKGYDPIAFRLLVLQAHYRSLMNFTWESLDASQKTLNGLRAFADLRFQTNSKASSVREMLSRDSIKWTLSVAQEDLQIPTTIAHIHQTKMWPDNSSGGGISGDDKTAFEAYLFFFDELLGLNLLASKDISNHQKSLINDREQARTAKDWAKADQIRKELTSQGIEINDTENGPIWSRSARQPLS
jgi:cysteinyl-tRNA synthetase